MTRRVLPFLLLGALAGCAGSPDAAPAASVPAAAGQGDPQPCDLLTSADVHAVLGEPVSAGELMGFECSYKRPANEKTLRVTAVQVRLEISDGKPQEVFDRYVNRMREGLGGQYELSSETGLGDIGSWDGDAMIAAKAVNRTRSAFVIVQLTGVDASRERALANALTDRALARLKKM